MKNKSFHALRICPRKFIAENDSGFHKVALAHFKVRWAISKYLYINFLYNRIYQNIKIL